MAQPIPIRIKTSHSDYRLQEKMAWFTQQPGCHWLANADLPYENLPTLHITRNQVYLSWGDSQRLMFHPSMALLRLLNLRHGQPDRFLEATGLQPGDTLLDLTLGLASDALVGAWAVGSCGHVIGIEKSPALCAIIRDGLASLTSQSVPKVSNPEKQASWMALIECSSRIQVIWNDHLTYLRTLPNDSVDVIYCDPMFDRTREQSSSIQPLHFWAEHGELTAETLLEARRVARKRIVIKVRKGTDLKALGFAVCSGGKYSEVDYGVIEVISCNP